MADPQTMAEGWECLLHACCQHLYGTRADALSPAVRAPLKLIDVEADKARRDERRRALQSESVAEGHATLLTVLLRLTPALPALRGVLGSLGFEGASLRAFGATALPPSLARAVTEARNRELKLHLRRLMPPEVCPAPKGSLVAEGEGSRLWLVPPPLSAMPPRALKLLNAIGGASPRMYML